MRTLWGLMAILSLFPSGAVSAAGRISDVALRIVAVSPAGEHYGRDVQCITRPNQDLAGLE
jgi:hypothetical protein